MTVLKFGGTSVSTPERIHTICEVVKSEASAIVVVSAIRGVTDLLLEIQHANSSRRNEILSEIEILHVRLAEQTMDAGLSQVFKQYCARHLSNLKDLPLIKAATKEQSDSTVAYGELLASQLIANALDAAGVPAEQVSATECIITTESFGGAEFLPGPTRRNMKRVLLPLVSKGIVPVVTGFVGATKDGRVTTLGRGGSDYSASIIAYALAADELQIWTDVDGMYTADPKEVQGATVLQSVTYREASELAAFGAKVLHPRTIRPAVSADIPVRVLNTCNPDQKGTQIVPLLPLEPRIAAIAAKKSVTLVNLYSTNMLLSKGYLKKVFSIFASYNISIDLVSVSEVSVSVTLDNNERLTSVESGLARVVDDLAKFSEVTTQNVGMVSLIGEKITSIPHMMRSIFEVMDKQDIPVHMISMGASDINISLVIDPNKVNMAVAALHQDMILGKNGPAFTGNINVGVYQ